MHDFTRRTLLQGGTALATASALTGPALLNFAKAWAQAAPWKAEPGAKLTVMRWKRHGRGLQGGHRHRDERIQRVL